MVKKFFKEHEVEILLAIFAAVGFVLGLVIGISTHETNENFVIEYIYSEVEEATQEETAPVSDIATEKEDGRTLTVRATAYCPCEECSEGYGTMTATGVTAKAGRTIAVDPKVIPYGTEVVIDGHTYIAEDTGGFIKGNRIDIYFDSHSDALDFGVQELTIFVKEKGEK